MRRFSAISLIGLVFSVLSGCGPANSAFLHSTVDRSAYRADRAAVTSYFAPAGKAAPPTALTGLPGRRVTDAASAATALLQAAGAPGDQPDLNATATFLAGVMTDPEVLCGDTSAVSFTGLCSDYTLISPERQPGFFLHFPDCSAAVLGPFGYANMSVARVTMTEGGTNLDPTQDRTVRFAAEMAYRLDTPKGRAAATMSWTGAFLFEAAAPGLINGWEIRAPKLRAGLGWSGYAAPAAFPVTTRTPGVKLGTPGTQAAVAVERALVAWVRATSVQATLNTTTTDKGADPVVETGAGTVYPALGTAELSGQTSAGAVGIRFTDKSVVYVQPAVTADEPSPHWLRSDLGRAMPAELLTYPSVYATTSLLARTRSAASAPCPEKLTAEACYRVEVPLVRAMLPGTASYRTALAAVGTGERTTVLHVGVTREQLVFVRQDERTSALVQVAGTSTVTWSFTSYDAAPAAEVEVPADAVDLDDLDTLSV